jgi:hypothetical protein
MPDSPDHDPGEQHEYSDQSHDKRRIEIECFTHVDSQRLAVEQARPDDTIYRFGRSRRYRLKTTS